MPVAEATEKRVRTTVSLPQPIYDEVRRFVEEKVSPADSVNAFFVAAIVSYVKFIRRKQIDAQFAAMGEDTDYQKEAKLISEEFSNNDWEAFEIAEKDA
jgi:hypothetical protein